MTDGEYLYTIEHSKWCEFDEECYDFDKAKELLKKKIQEYGVDKGYLAIAKEVTIEDILSSNDYAEDVINAIAENTCDNYGEYAENYLEDVPTTQMDELDFMLKNTIAEWLRKHNYKPNIFRLIGETKVEPQGERVVSRLKPCPFCGGEAKCNCVGDDEWVYFYTCSKCRKTPISKSECTTTIRDAIDIWNKRCDDV
jgi:hypothetical protein